jgi:hypothetical protein
LEENIVEFHPRDIKEFNVVQSIFETVEEKVLYSPDFQRYLVHKSQIKIGNFK